MKKNPNRLCSTKGCGREYSARGLCKVHYDRKHNPVGYYRYENYKKICDFVKSKSDFFDTEKGMIAFVVGGKELDKKLSCIFLKNSAEECINLNIRQNYLRKVW